MAVLETKTHGGRHVIRFTDGNHQYKVDGLKKWGVTKVIGILAKDGLVQWAANKACDYIRLNCESDAGPGFFDVTEEHLQEVKRAHATLRDDAAETGKRVHKWCEEHIKGNDIKITEDMKPSVDAFLQWEAKEKPNYLFSERVTYSEELDLCGTTDLGAVIRGKYTILDFKTGKPEQEYDSYRRTYTGRNRGYSTVFVQDAFYDIGISETDEILADQYGVLYLPVTGGYHMFLTDNVAFFRKFARAILVVARLADEANRIINPFINKPSKEKK